jgi:hypothetical protein
MTTTGTLISVTDGIDRDNARLLPIKTLN